MCICMCIHNVRIYLGMIPSPSKLEDVDDRVFANTCLVSYLPCRTSKKAIRWLLVSLDFIAPRPDG